MKSKILNWILFKLFNRQLFDIVEAIVKLERAGKKFCIDYGYTNAVEQAKKLNL